MESKSEVSHLSARDEVGRNRIDVDVVTADVFVESRSLTVEAIKIDAEGHDIDIIKGSLAVLSSQKPTVLTEARPEERLFTLLAGVSYRVFAFVRSRRSRSRSFEELAIEERVSGDTKMLFLVPEQMANTLKERARLLS